MATLTPQMKEGIDKKSYTELLYDWRFAPVGDELFQGETGEYYMARMKELRALPGGTEAHVTASKQIGWER